jgi:hypothetical protein
MIQTSGSIDQFELFRIRQKSKINYLR